MEDRIRKQIELDAPVSRVWKALTDSREFGEWFNVNLPGPFVAGQPLVGHITLKGWEHLTMAIVVKKIEPETYFSYTWHPYAIDPKADYSKEEPTLVEFHLQPAAKGTLLTVTESGFSKIPAARRDEAFRMNSNGWAQQLNNISKYVG